MPLPEIPYDAWFDNKVNPLDLMPIATDEPLDLAPSSVEPQEEEETIHEKMYRIATDKYNPFSVGGSESICDK
tara:strand:+ start:1047 stop:1265 length:219 start_codon:yes stop_codon:yes gene_type:complete